MKPTTILYETTPIRRIGVRKDDAVVIGANYSCFAYMLEEYISYGVLSIIIPSSSPEISIVDEIPELLKKRLTVVNDQNDREAVARILFSLRREFDLEISDAENSLRFPKGIEFRTQTQIKQIHDDVKRFAFGFNHGVHIELNIAHSIETIRQIRRKVQDNNTRAILSHFEGILSRYEPLSFGSIVPKNSTPKELISIFDRLLNDPAYIIFSESVSKLSEPETREKTLLEMRDFARRISSTRFVGATWDYITKVLRVWPGIPLPESKDFAAIVKGRSVPTIVDLAEPRSRAVENWFAYAKQNPPIGRDGKQLSGDNVEWLPPLPSMKAGGPSSQSLSLGTVGELRHLLIEFENKSKSK